FLRPVAVGATPLGVDLNRSHNDPLIVSIGYMDVRIGSATLAKTSTSTFFAPARSSTRGAALDRGAGNEHIVENDEPTARDRRLALFRHAEGALDVGGALGSRQPDLLDGRFYALERGCHHRDAARRRHRSR